MTRFFRRLGVKIRWSEDSLSVMLMTRNSDFTRKMSE